MKLKPKCFDSMELAVDNRGHLIPCCYCDTVATREDKEYQKLYAVSKINDYDDVKEILMTDEWIKFKDNLLNDIGPPACIDTCRVKDDYKKKEKYTMPDGKEINRVV